MLYFKTFFSAILLTFFVAFVTLATDRTPMMNSNADGKNLVTQLNVNIIVKAIEPSLPFWAAIGFNATEQVPVDGPGGSGPLGFTIITNGDQQFMMQSVASIGADITIFSDTDLTASPVVLFIIVEDIDVLEQSLSDYTPIFSKRKTFYGAIESGYFTPDGTQVTFAAFNQP